MARKKAVDPTVAEGVRLDLAELAERAPDLARSALAASALVLAREMDGNNSLTSKSMAAGRLLDTMAALRAMAPPAPVEDSELERRRRAREQRLARQAASGAPSSS